MSPHQIRYSQQIEDKAEVMCYPPPEPVVVPPGVTDLSWCLASDNLDHQISYTAQPTLRYYDLMVPCILGWQTEGPWRIGPCNGWMGYKSGQNDILRNHRATYHNLTEVPYTIEVTIVGVWTSGTRAQRRKFGGVLAVDDPLPSPGPWSGAKRGIMLASQQQGADVSRAAKVGSSQVQDGPANGSYAATLPAFSNDGPHAQTSNSKSNANLGPEVPDDYSTASGFAPPMQMPLQSAPTAADHRFFPIPLTDANGNIVEVEIVQSQYSEALGSEMNLLDVPNRRDDSPDVRFSSFSGFPSSNMRNYQPGNAVPEVQSPSIQPPSAFFTHRSHARSHEIPQHLEYHPELSSHHQNSVSVVPSHDFPENDSRNNSTMETFEEYMVRQNGSRIGP